MEYTKKDKWNISLLTTLELIQDLTKTIYDQADAAGGSDEFMDGIALVMNPINKQLTEHRNKAKNYLLSTIGEGNFQVNHDNYTPRDRAINSNKILRMAVAGLEEATHDTVPGTEIYEGITLAVTCLKSALTNAIRSAEKLMLEFDQGRSQKSREDMN